MSLCNRFYIFCMHKSTNDYRYIYSVSIMLLCLRVCTQMFDNRVLSGLGLITELWYDYACVMCCYLITIVISPNLESPETDRGDYVATSWVPPNISHVGVFLFVHNGHVRRVYEGQLSIHTASKDNSKFQLALTWCHLFRTINQHCTDIHTAKRKGHLFNPARTTNWPIGHQKIVLAVCFSIVTVRSGYSVRFQIFDKTH